MNFNREIPIYLQLHDYFQNMILSGKLTPGMPISSVRKIATETQVNANTVQHAMISLIHEGLVESHKNKGYLVINDKKKIMYQHQQVVQRTTYEFLHKMKALGYNKQQIIEAVIQYSLIDHDGAVPM
jgi:DNA-binding transcriptional regulator YhcF (GntR family)